MGVQLSERRHCMAPLGAQLSNASRMQQLAKQHLKRYSHVLIITSSIYYNISENILQKQIN